MLIVHRQSGGHTSSMAMLSCILNVELHSVVLELVVPRLHLILERRAGLVR